MRSRIRRIPALARLAFALTWVIFATGPSPARAETLIVEDFLQLPASSGSRPLARINVLREAPDGSGRLFVNDLRGPLFVYDGGAVSTYIDLSSEFSPHFKLSPGLGSGFVSFAFHPEFASNGLFYTVHTEFVNGTPNFTPPKAIPIIQHAVLSEFEATTPSSSVFSGTRRELMRIASPHTYHNLQEINFDPNALPADADYGLLYIAAGDFGSIASGDPDQLQRLDTVYGSILRIDPLGGPFMRGGIGYDYGIPPTNPYVDGDPDTLDEIYAHGFRNPHRLIWDPEGNGSLFVSDIGEDHREEIDLVLPHRNYGWPFREGELALDPYTDPGVVFPLPPDDASYGYTYPVALYDHTGVNAIAGGIAYRGADRPELDGRFLFGDIADGSLWYAEIADLEAADDGDPATLAAISDVVLEFAGQPTNLLQIVRDELNDPNVDRVDLRLHVDLAGNPYMTTKQDGLLRTIPEPSARLQLLSGVGFLMSVARRRGRASSGRIDSKAAGR